MWNLATNPKIDQSEVTADNTLLLTMSCWCFSCVTKWYICSLKCDNCFNDEAFKSDFIEIDEVKEDDKTTLPLIDIA